MTLLGKSIKRTLILVGFCSGLALAHSATAATLNLDFNYRLTPNAGDLGITVATARFEDIITVTGYKGIDLVLTNLASDQVPGVGSTSYISGLLTAFNYEDAELPNIIVEQFTDDQAQSDRWEPQEDVATVDGFTFTSELGFPKGTSSPTSSTSLASLRPGESAHVQFWWNDGLADGDISVDAIIASIRGSSANPLIPDIIAAVKVRSIGALSGGENIESVPTIVVGAQLATVPLPAALPLFLSALAGLGFCQRRRRSV